MLKILRKKGVAKKILWVVAVVIIISFGFFGTAYLLLDSGPVNYAGILHGKKIPLDEFNKAYQATRIQAIRQYGSELEKIAHLLNLDARAWDRLILLHEAGKKRISASNPEVIQAISQDATFQKNGQFDSLLYNAILRNLGIRPREYEEIVRDNIKISKLVQDMTSTVTVSEEEIFNAFKETNEKVQASYIFVANDAFKTDLVPQEDELKQYYEEHKTDFMTPPSVNAQYLTLPFPPSSQPEQSQEAGSETATAQDEQLESEKDIVRDQAEEAFQELLINPNMEEIGKKYGVTPQTTGFYSKEQPNLALGWPYELLAKTFELGQSQVNHPFETTAGMVIVQIKEIREAYIPDYNEAKDKVSLAVIEQKAKELAKAKAEEYREALLAGMDKTKVWDFAEAAKTLGVEIAQTPVFNRGQYLPQIGLSKEFQEAAFALTEDSMISGVIETEKGFCILHRDSYVPVEQSDFEKAKNDLAQSIYDDKRNQAFGEYTLQLRQESGLIDNIPELRGRASQ